MPWILISMFLLGAIQLHAGNVPDWHVGDIATQDIRTPVTMDVVDAEATAISKAEAALKTPAFFIAHPGTTNTMVQKVTAAFASSHADFMIALENAFHQTNLSETVIQSDDFDDFVQVFNARAKELNSKDKLSNFSSKRLSISPGLARQWARGETGSNTMTNYLKKLLKATDRPVRPDPVAGGLVLGNTARLVPFHKSGDDLTLEEAEQAGPLVNLSSVATLTQVRNMFRREFSPEDKALAQSVGMYIHFNYYLDTNLTQIARERAVSPVTVAYHYDAGQIIVRQGQVVDAKMLAALTRLNETLAEAQPKPPVAAASEPAQTEPMPASQIASTPTLSGQKPDIRAEYLWLGAACSAVSVVVLLGFWRLQSSKNRAALTTPRPTEARLPRQTTIPAELAPQLAEILKSAVVQELATQRHQLLQAQQLAATEIVQLMQRLNEVRAPLQERLAAYEQQIQELERELGQQSKENRELLRLQIELLKKQVQAERAAGRMDFN